MDSNCTSCRRNRVLKRLAVYLPLLALTVYLCWNYAEPINTQLHFALATRAVMASQTNRADVIYTYHPADGQLVSTLALREPQSLGTDDDGCHLIPHHILPPGGADDSATLDLFNQYLGYLLTDYSETLFAHSLTAPNGQIRLVILMIHPDPHPAVIPQLQLESFILDPGSWITPPKQLAHRHFTLSDDLAPLTITRFHPGHVSQDNPAVFTVAYEGASFHHTATFALNADGTALEEVASADH